MPPQVPSQPAPLSNCMYNVSSDSEPFVSAACSSVLPPVNASLVNTSMKLTSLFSQCQKDFNCSKEQVCSHADQLSCLLQICEVAAANSSPGQKQSNLEVYTDCFIAVFQSLGMAPNMTLVFITTVSWFEYCLMEKAGNYSSCIYTFSKICFLEELPGSTMECLMALPILCGMFESNFTLQRKCAFSVDMVLREILPSMCGEMNNQDTCVSVYCMQRSMNCS